VLSPHVGGSTKQASKAAVDAALANLDKWLKSGKSPHEVDLVNAY